MKNAIAIKLEHRSVKMSMIITSFVKTLLPLFAYETSLQLLAFATSVVVAVLSVRTTALHEVLNALVYVEPMCCWLKRLQNFSNGPVVVAHEVVV